MSFALVWGSTHHFSLTFTIPKFKTCLNTIDFIFFIFKNIFLLEYNLKSWKIKYQTYFNFAQLKKKKN